MRPERGCVLAGPFRAPQWRMGRASGFSAYRRATILAVGRFCVCMLLSILACTKSTRNWTRPTGLSAEEAVVSTNAVLETLYAQGFESERLDLVDSGLLIKAKFNGHEKKMLLDTGATLSSISKGRAETYGLEFGEERAAYGVTWYDVLKGQQLALARSFQVAGFEYSPWLFGTHESYTGHPILGTEYLNFSGAVIFTRFRFLALHPQGQSAKSLASVLKKHGYSELRMRAWDYSATLKVMRKGAKPIYFGVPHVDIELSNGKKGRMIIDTGAHMSIIYRNLVAKEGVDLYRYQDSASADVAGNVQDKFGVLLDGLTINGTYRCKEPSLFNAIDISRRRKKMEAVGLKEDVNDFGALGLDFLVDHNAIIDVGNMMLYLRFR